MILLNIIQMSVAAAVLIVLILTVRLLAAHRIPRSTYSLLWTIALLRLIVPLSLPPLLRINAPSLDISRRVTILIEDAFKAAADDQRSPEAGAEAETEAEIMLPGEELPMAQVNEDEKTRGRFSCPVCLSCILCKKKAPKPSAPGPFSTCEYSSYFSPPTTTMFLSAPCSAS